MSGAVLNFSVIARLQEALAPFGRRSLEAYITSLEDSIAGHGKWTSPPEVLEEEREVWTPRLSRGEWYSWTGVSHLDKDKIERVWEPISDVARWNDYERIAFQLSVFGNAVRLNITAWIGGCEVEVEAPDEDITDVVRIVRGVLSEYIDEEMLPKPSPFTVFIGHGGDRKWEAVRDFLRAEGFEVDWFEGSDRTSKSTLEVVEQMISTSSVGVCIMTAADRLESGEHLARQNVVHEIGFCQGRLGTRNTIVLLEDGVQEFSNIVGITQIRFRNGEVHTTKDELVAALRNRERERAGA